MRNKCNLQKLIFESGEPKIAQNINGYLLDATNIVVNKISKPINFLPSMDYGNKPVDGGYLILSPNEAFEIQDNYPEAKKFIRRFIGSQELIKGIERYCLWIDDDNLTQALTIEPIRLRIEACKKMRLSSRDEGANKMALRAHQFREFRSSKHTSIVIPRVSSENREYLPVDLLSHSEIISDRNFVIYDGPLWTLSLIASKMHHIWIATICVRLRSDFSYSNTLGWNTFPVPILSDDDKKNLEQSAKKIILAREEHYPATIAKLYDHKKMPENLRQAHQENDQLLESLYRKKPFENDQERLEYLFKCYSELLNKSNTKI
jgi:hypothetical protein